MNACFLGAKEFLNKAHGVDKQVKRQSGLSAYPKVLTVSAKTGLNNNKSL